MFIIQFQNLDYDDYPVGSPRNQIGPFDTYESAAKWVYETYGKNYYHVRDHLGGYCQITDLRLTSPEEAAHYIKENK